MDELSLCGLFVALAALLYAAAGPVKAQYVAMVFGIAGAVVLGLQGVNPALGFAAFLASNIGWLIFGYDRRHWGLVGQQVAFLGTSLFGLWTWWLDPLLSGVRT